MGMLKKISAKLMALGVVIVALASYLLGRKAMADQQSRAELQRNKAEATAREKRFRLAQQIDQEVSKKNAEIHRDNVADTLNQLFDHEA